MTDAVIIAVVTSVVGAAATVVTSIVSYKIAKLTAIQKKISDKQDVIHEQIDGMQDKLLAANKLIDKAEGAKENQAETDAKKQEDK